MLEQLLNVGTNGTLSLTSAILTVVVPFILGLIISLTYMKTADKETYSQGFCYTLIIVPVVSSIIIMLVGTNLAAAFSVGGAFSLVRFRSEAGSAKNIAYIFFTMAAGLASGVQQFAYAAAFTVALCLIMIVFESVGFGRNKGESRVLKILVPESLNYTGAFDEILNDYTLDYKLDRIKTVDLGSMYELTYHVVLDKRGDVKKFIDDLRCRNGNLSVELILSSNVSGF